VAEVQSTKYKVRLRISLCRTQQKHCCYYIFIY